MTDQATSTNGGDASPNGEPTDADAPLTCPQCQARSFRATVITTSRIDEVFARADHSVDIPVDVFENPDIVDVELVCTECGWIPEESDWMLT